MSFVDNDFIFLEIDTASGLVVNSFCSPTPDAPAAKPGCEYISAADHPEVGIGFTRNPDGSFAPPATEEI